MALMLQEQQYLPWEIILLTKLSYLLRSSQFLLHLRIKVFWYDVYQYELISAGNRVTLQQKLLLFVCFLPAVFTFAHEEHKTMQPANSHWGGYSLWGAGTAGGKLNYTQWQQLFTCSIYSDQATIDVLLSSCLTKLKRKCLLSFNIRAKCS